MKKVILYQAKDGSNHATPKLCAEHDRKLLLAPAVEAFVAGLDDASFAKDDRDNDVIYSDGLASFIVANADALRKVLTEPLITRRPRKNKAAKADVPTPAKVKPAAEPEAPAASLDVAAAASHVLSGDEELEAVVAALNA
jgi:hypothetical protein